MQRFRVCSEMASREVRGRSQRHSDFTWEASRHRLVIREGLEIAMFSLCGGV